MPRLRVEGMDAEEGELRHIVVWTPSDIVGLGFLGVVILWVGGYLVYCRIMDWKGK